MGVEDECGGEDVGDEGGGDAVEEWFWGRWGVVVEWGWGGGAGVLLEPEEVEVVVLETAEAVAVWGEWWEWW